MEDAQAPEVRGFSVDRLLGQGGSASVWLVRQERTGHVFALKCFGRGGEAEDTDGFPPGALTADGVRREINTLSVLAHPHLVRGHEVVTVRDSSGERPALLMEYASGGSLAALVAARGQLTVGETVTVLTPLAQVLAYLHRKGMTHSDVSPGNILFTGQGKPLLADLGITRMVGDPGGGSGRGTPGFTDPAPVDAVRAGLRPEGDVYAAAAVGWFCLTGSAPPRSSLRPPLALLRPEVPKELAAALESGLNEDRRLRPAATELATAVYRSAAPLPLDLAPAVHPTVIPELMTRRHVPAKQASAFRGRMVRGRMAGLARTFSTRLPGTGRRPPRMPFPAAAPAIEPASAASAAPGAGLAPAKDIGKNTGQATGQLFAPARGRHAAQQQPARLLGTGGRGVLWPNRHLPNSVRPLAVGMLALMVAAGWWFSTILAAPQAAAPSNAGAAAQQGTAVREEQSRRDGGVAGRAAAELERARRHASAADPAEAVLGLAALRSLAFSLGRPELLDEVNRAGSPADAADRKTAQKLVAADTVLAGFTTALSAVQTEAGATDKGAIVRATSATSAYEVRDASGALVDVGRAAQPQSLRLVLVPDGGRWRIAEILPGA